MAPRKLTTLEERKALVKACLDVDINRLGKIPVSALGNVLAAVDSKVRYVGFHSL